MPYIQGTKKLLVYTHIITFRSVIDIYFWILQRLDNTFSHGTSAKFSSFIQDTIKGHKVVRYVFNFSGRKCTAIILLANSLDQSLHTKNSTASHCNANCCVLSCFPQDLVVHRDRECHLLNHHLDSIKWIRKQGTLLPRWFLFEPNLVNLNTLKSSVLASKRIGHTLRIEV